LFFSNAVEDSNSPLTPAVTRTQATATNVQQTAASSSVYNRINSVNVSAVRTKMTNVQAHRASIIPRTSNVNSSIGFRRPLLNVSRMDLNSAVKSPVSPRTAALARPLLRTPVQRGSVSPSLRRHVTPDLLRGPGHAGNHRGNSQQFCVSYHQQNSVRPNRFNNANVSQLRSSQNNQVRIILLYFRFITIT